MNIALFADTFLPQTDGVVSTVEALAKGLADRGHSILVFAPDYDTKEVFSYPGVQIVRIKSTPMKFYDDYRISTPVSPSMIKAMKIHNIDVAHFHTPFMVALQGITLCKMFKIPLIGTFHTFQVDEQYLEHVKLNVKGMDKIAWKILLFYYNRANFVTAPSKYTLSEVKKNGCKPQMKYISNGIDLTQFANDDSGSWNKKHGDNLVLFIGRVANEKNILVLLSIFRKVVQSCPDAKLLIVGSGPQDQQVKDEVKKLQLEDNVVILGRIQHDELLRSGIFGACNVFATASVTENQPVTILEAQANGMVVVGARSRGIPDLIEEGVNGFTVDPDDESLFAQRIAEVLTDSDLREKLQQGTRALIKQHDITTVLDEWEALYAHVVHDHKK